jgi:hypothetical protein
MIKNHVWVKRLTSLALITVLVGSGLILQVKPVQAASIILVTDFLGDDPTKSACTNAIDDCSLRGAIMHVNADPTLPKPDYHIQLAGATYTLTNHGANENGNVTGDLDIQYSGGSVFIEGASAATSIIDGDLADRVIHLYYGSLTLSDLSIKRGNTSALVIPGAGIYARPGTSLSLFGVEVSDNMTSHNGGGIHVDQATLFIFDSYFHNNQAGGGGGGLSIMESTSTIIAVMFFQNTTLPGTSGGGLSTYGVGTTNVYNSAFIDNTAEFGGGISNGTGHTLNIYDSAILDNQAYAGAGIYAEGIFNLERAYISGNIAESNGGGLTGSGTFSLIDVTIANNTSDGFAGIYVLNPIVGVTSGTLDHVTITGNTSSGFRPALFIHSGTVNLMNSIINATDGNNACEYPNFNSFLISSDYNIANDATCNLTQTHDHPSTDPQLATPGYYGAMLIASPLAGSIAIDHANPTFLPGDIDQRAVLRQDGDLNGSVLPDIGAAEFLTAKQYLPILRKP